MGESSKHADLLIHSAMEFIWSHFAIGGHLKGKNVGERMEYVDVHFDMWRFELAYQAKAVKELMLQKCQDFQLTKDDVNQWFNPMGGPPNNPLLLFVPNVSYYITHLWIYLRSRARIA